MYLSPRRCTRRRSLSRCRRRDAGRRDILQREPRPPGEERKRTAARPKTSWRSDTPRRGLPHVSRAPSQQLRRLLAARHPSNASTCCWHLCWRHTRRHVPDTAPRVSCLSCSSCWPYVGTLDNVRTPRLCEAAGQMSRHGARNKTRRLSCLHPPRRRPRAPRHHRGIASTTTSQAGGRQKRLRHQQPGSSRAAGRAPWVVGGRQQPPAAGRSPGAAAGGNNALTATTTTPGK